MRGASSVAPGDLKIAREFVRRLAEQIDSGRFQVTLFGSRARGDADEESDLDLFVRLKENDPARVIKALVSNIACDLTLEYGVCGRVRGRRTISQSASGLFLPGHCRKGRGPVVTEKEVQSL